MVFHEFDKSKILQNESHLMSKIKYGARVSRLFFIKIMYL